MNGHAAKLPAEDEARVAPDVASRPTWSGRANPDARYFCELTVAELPWPLRFAFVRVCDEDGSERWTCCGLEIGRPILRDEDGLDSEQFELTPQRWRTIADNFDRYRLMAERRLIPTPENLERAGRIRRAMRRKPGEPWTDEALALLATEYQALEGTRGRNWMLAQRLGISRSNLQRALATAKRKGLMQSRVGI